MSDTPYELPKAAEKLSYKFILDAIQEKTLKPQAAAEMVPSEPPPAAEVAAPEMPSEIAEEASERLPMPVKPLELPVGKKYFRIGEVSELLGVEAYVLRYWENEFPMVHPNKTKNGHRVYSRKEVELLHLIEHLLHVEKFSIKGARKQLQERRRQQRTAPDAGAQKNHALLKELAQQLKELIQLARRNPGI